MKNTTLAARAAFFQEARKNSPVRPKTVYYQAFRTCIMSCSPFAIFQELMGDQSFDDFEHIWVYGSDEALGYDTFKRFSGRAGVRYVEAGSQEQAQALATCQYLITNAALPSYWQKREGQIVINTWHGTPLKTLGKDARDFMGSAIGNAQRNFLLTDYLVMPNRYTADHLIDSYCVSTMFRGKVVDVGAPRVDAVLNSNKERTRGLLEEKYGASLEGKKIVLYAPTFRSEGGKSVNTTDVMAAHMSELQSRMPQDYVVFFKVHNIIGKYFVGNAIMRSRLIFDEIETNELLGVTDVLITDYSSIFFDFICTGKPVLLFVYDKEQYAADHGMYLRIEDMPGAECGTMDDVFECIGRIREGTYENPNREFALKTFAYNDTGSSSKRAVDIIFRGLPGAEGEVIDYAAVDGTAAGGALSGELSAPAARASGEDDGEGGATGETATGGTTPGGAPGGALVGEPAGGTTPDGAPTGKVGVLVSLENEPLLSATRALSRLLKSLDPATHQVTIAAHNVHLIWKECARVFPEARIVFFDIESAEKLAGDTRDQEFFREQFEGFFPGMQFHQYYNLKSHEGFLDEILRNVAPSMRKFWHLCWSDKLNARKVARLARHYEDVVVYASHNWQPPAALRAASATVVTDTAMREEPDHVMTVLFLASFDSINHTLATCARRLDERGHRAIVAVNDTGNYINTHMFMEGDYDVVPIKAVDDASLPFVDMVVGTPLKSAGQARVYRHVDKHGLMVFSFCNLFSSVAMRINPDIVFTLGEAKNEELRAYNLHYNCVATGNPQYDRLLELRKPDLPRPDLQSPNSQEPGSQTPSPQKPDPQDIRKVLVVEQGGYPYGEQGKRQLAEMLLRIAAENPLIEFTVKPRYLPTAEKGSLHNVSEHVYDFLREPPENLHLMTEHCSVEDIVADFDAMITMWSTAFLDAMVMGMPLLLIEGLSSVDVFDVRHQRIEEAYEHLRATGCLRRFDEVGANIADDFRIVSEDFAQHEVFDYRNPATGRVVRFLELAYHTLVKPNLRICDDFCFTEPEYYARFGELNLVDADSVQYRAAKAYRNALNTALQEYVYLNRCMGAVLDLSELEEYYDVMPPDLEGAALERYLEELDVELFDVFNEAQGRYFESEEGKRRIEEDRILQDFYFNWLYATHDFERLENPPLRNLLAPESREYNLALAALDRLQVPQAYDHLYAFLRLSREQPVQQLLKCKRMKESTRPFRRGPGALLFFLNLLKDENAQVVDYLYKEPDRMPLVALHKARQLNKQGRYEDCIVLCDLALLHNSAKGKRANDIDATVKMYVKKAFYRAVAAERSRAYAKAKDAGSAGRP